MWREGGRKRRHGPISRFQRPSSNIFANIFAIRQPRRLVPVMEGTRPGGASDPIRQEFGTIDARSREETVALEADV